MSKIYAIIDHKHIVWIASDQKTRLTETKFFSTREKARQNLLSFVDRVKKAQTEDPEYCKLVRQEPDQIVYGWGWEDMNYLGQISEHTGKVWEGWLIEIVELDCE